MARSESIAMMTSPESSLAPSADDPGTTRRILPILLFQKFEMVYDADECPSHIYLLAFCQTRQQARTFRLDRIQPVAAITGR